MSDDTLTNVADTAHAAADRADEALTAVAALTGRINGIDEHVRTLHAYIEARAASGSPVNLTAGTWVIGISTGARHLGLSEEAFRTARARHPITGERVVGVLPAWPASNLEAWKEGQQP